MKWQEPIFGLHWTAQLIGETSVFPDLCEVGGIIF